MVESPCSTCCQALAFSITKAKLVLKAPRIRTCFGPWVCALLGEGGGGFAASFPPLESGGQPYLCLLPVPGAWSHSHKTGMYQGGYGQWCLPRRAEQWAAPEGISIIHVVASFYIR